VIDLTYGESVTAAIQTSFIASRGFRYGVDKRDYARYFDKTVEQIETDSHVVTNTGRALNLFSINLDDCDMRPRVFISDENKNTGREFTNGLRKKYKSLIGVNLSAGRPGRVWPIEKYSNLVESLIKQYDDSIIVLSYAPGDNWKADQLLTEYDERLVSIPSGMNIIQVAGLLSCLDYLITPDTSIYHFAVALDIPSVVLFSGHQENYTRWGPYSPGILPVRSNDINSIESISPDEVVKSFRTLVGVNKAGE